MHLTYIQTEEGKQDRGVQRCVLEPPFFCLFFFKLLESSRIRKNPFFTEFDESVTDQRTDGPTNGQTDKASYRDPRTQLKRFQKSAKAQLLKLERFSWSHWIRICHGAR